MKKRVYKIIFIIFTFYNFLSPCIANERQTLDLKRLISKAVNQGETYVRIPPGEYNIDKKIYLNNVNNLVIDGKGVKLFIIKIGPLFHLDGCNNLTIKGFTIDYDPLPFTQGTITSILNKKGITFAIHKGYPDLTENNLYESLYVFDKSTSRWKHGVGDIYGDMKVVNARTGYLKSKREQPLLEVGDLVAIAKRRGSLFHSFGGTKNILYEDLTILSSPSIVFSGRFTGVNHKFNRIKITKGKRPQGATEERLISSNADGINYGICDSSPSIENSELAFMGDDIMNFHGPHFPIIKVESPTSFLTVRIQKFRNYKYAMKKGGVLRHLAIGTYEVLGTSKLNSIEQVKRHGFDKKYLKKYLPEYLSNYCDKGNCTVYRIKIESPIDLKVGQSMDFPEANCSGFKVNNSYFHDNRGKLRIMSSDGVIENNRFERQRNTAITIGNEYRYWGEAGWANNIIIRNNIFKDIGLGNVFKSTNKTPAAISIYTVNTRGNQKYIAGHSNILIEKNTIENSLPAAINVYGAKNVIIKNNIIKNSYSLRSKNAGSKFNISPKSEIDVQLGTKGKLQNNIILFGE